MLDRELSPKLEEFNPFEAHEDAPWKYQLEFLSEKLLSDTSGMTERSSEVQLAITSTKFGDGDRSHEHRIRPQTGRLMEQVSTCQIFDVSKRHVGASP